MRLRRNADNSGSITVFLSLILLLILSLLFTIIEGARVSIAKVYAERSLTTAMDSVLADFYGPLWNEYHMFGLDTGPGGDEVGKEEISSQLQDYMSYTFEPNKDIDGSYPDRLELYDISVDSLSVSDSTMLTDYQGELFINQAVEYMKYKELGDGVEQLLKKMSLMETPQKVSVLYEEKQKVEEELVEIDEGILELMKLLDGVKTGKKGIEVTKDGRLKTIPYFVKKICLGTITKEVVGINQESIFLALKDSYVNPVPDLGAIEDNINSLEEIMKQMNQTEAEYKDTMSAISEDTANLEKLNSIKDKSEAVKAQIKEEKALIKYSEAQKDELLKELKTYKTMEQSYLDNIHTIKYNLSHLISEIIPCISSSITTIDKILIKTKVAEPLISGYEKSLYLAKDEIGNELYSNMEEDLDELKRYTLTNDQGYDFAGMKQTLENDLSVVSQVESLLEKGEQELSLKAYQNAEETFLGVKNLLNTYQTDNLTLDYSTLVLKKDDNLNPLDHVSSFLEEGITGLVIDPNTISNAKLTEEMLPSVIAAMSEEEEGFLDQLNVFFENSIIGNKNTETGSLFGSFGEDAAALSAVGEVVNTLAEKLLFQEYLKEHFYSFSEEGEDLNARKPSVLSYEQEYLLAGKTSDKDNLSSVISRILFLRTILDFVSILGDKDKCMEAEAAAAALVGFTGLPILVSITKTLILLVWSFSEGLVDTCAMLMGKEVPILKKNVTLTFPEIFLLNRSMIQKKASQMAETKQLLFSYHDYLYVFLLARNRKEEAYRSMDLIQENIRVRYFDDFSFQNCLFGFNAEASFLINSKFSGFSFVQKQLGSSPKGFKFSTKASYSY